MKTLIEHSGLNRTGQQHYLRSVYFFIAGAMLLTVLLVNNTCPVRDGDVYFHLKYGEYHLQHKTLLMDHSIFSWTPAVKHAPYNTWLADIFFYTIYKLGDWPLLFFLKYLFMLFPLVAVWLYARQTAMGKHILTPFVLIIVQLSISYASYVKPEIISLLFFTILAFLYFYIKKHHNGRLFLIYPLMFFLWVNMHGVAFLGLILLSTITCGEVSNYLFKNKFAMPRNNMALLVISGLLSAAATLLNPYGFDLHLNFIGVSQNTTTQEVTNAIRAFEPLVNNLFMYGVKHYMQYWGVMACLLTILLFASIRKLRSLDLGVLLPNLFLGALYLLYTRSTYYWPPFWAMSFFYLSQKNCLNLPAMIQNAKPMAKHALICILAVFSLFFSLRVIHEDIYDPEQWTYLGLGFSYVDPVQESTFLKKHKIGTKLFNTYNTGGYLLYDLVPDYKVFIDSRFFPYKEHHIFSKYMDLCNGKISLEQIESEFGFDTAMVEHNHASMNMFITAEDWKLAYYGIAGAVFVKDHIDRPVDIRKLDKRRFDGIRNVRQAFDIAMTAQNLNDLETAAYIITSMKNNLSHMTAFPLLHGYLSRFQEGLEAYARDDFEKALTIFWRTGFQRRHFRASALLRQLINKKADFYLKKGQFKEALAMLEPIYRHHPNDGDVLYDTGVVAYLASSGHPGNFTQGSRIQWRDLLTRFLDTSPDHDHAEIAKQLLENKKIPENVPFILNSKINNPKLRTDE